MRYKESNLQDNPDYNLDTVVESDYINNPVPSFPDLKINQDNMLENELLQENIAYNNMSDSDIINDLQSQVDNRPPEPVSMVEKNPQENLLSEYRRLSKKDMSDAFSKQKDMEQRAALLQGLGQIVKGGAKLGRAEIDDNKVGADAIRRLGQVEVDQFKGQLELGNEVEMNDPNSDISKFMREQAKTVFPKFADQFENMTAKQLEKLPGLKNINSGKKNTRYVQIEENGKVRSLLIDMETGDVIRDLGLTGFAPSQFTDKLTGRAMVKTRADINAPAIPISTSSALGQPSEKVQKQGVSFGEFLRQAPEQGKNVEKVRSELIKDMKDQRDVATAVTNLKGKLTPGVSLNAVVDSGVLGGIQTQAAKMAGQKGVLTDQDLVKFAGAGGVSATISRLFSNLEGKMSEQDVKFFKRFADLMEKSLKEDINNQTQVYINNVLQSAQGINPNVSENDVKQWLSVDKIAPSVQTQKVKIQAPSGQVREVSEENAKEYLKRPGYKKVK